MDKGKIKRKIKVVLTKRDEDGNIIDRIELNDEGEDE